MSPSRLRPTAVLSAWTLLVWTTRIRNIWTDESLTTGGQVWRTALALVFTGFAVVALVAWFRAHRQRRGDAWVAPFVRLFAVWTAGVWVVRGAQIATGDHDGTFVAVHTALAVVSVVLAVVADRAVHRQSGEVSQIDPARRGGRRGRA